MTPIDASAVAELVKRLRERAIITGVRLHDEAATLIEQQSARIAELDFLNAGLSCMAERNEDADKKYEARYDALLRRDTDNLKRLIATHARYDALKAAGDGMAEILSDARQHMLDSAIGDGEKNLLIVALDFAVQDYRAATGKEKT